MQDSLGENCLSIMSSLILDILRLRAVPPPVSNDRAAKKWPYSWLTLSEQVVFVSIVLSNSRTTYESLSHRTILLESIEILR